MKTVPRRPTKTRRCPRCRRDVALVRNYLKPGTWKLGMHGPGPKGEFVCEEPRA